MRHRILTIASVTATLLAAATAHAGRWESIESLPDQKPVTVLVDEKPRGYFRITARAPLVVPIEGPARLRIVSRLELPPGSPEALSYRLRALQGTSVLEEQKTESSLSSRVRLASGAPVGKSRRMIVDVPAGRHSVTLAVDGSTSLLVRLQQGAPARGDESMVTLTPIDAERSVTVTEGEKTITYFTAIADHPVHLRVVGPTKLDLTTRLDFDPTMRGTHSYRLAVTEKSRTLRELTYKTTKSTTAVFASLKDRVPSKFDRAQIDVPDGTHEIAIALLDPRDGAVEIHARIPEPTVGGEE